MSDLSLGDRNEATEQTDLIGERDEDSQYPDDTVLFVAVNNSSPAERPSTAIFGVGGGRTGVLGVGREFGVLGGVMDGDVIPSLPMSPLPTAPPELGVGEISSAAVSGQVADGVGVLGVGLIGVTGDGETGVLGQGRRGVYGQSSESVGVCGVLTGRPRGDDGPPDSIGPTAVYGIDRTADTSTDTGFTTGVQGISINGIGVYAKSQQVAVWAQSSFDIPSGGAGIGVLAEALIGVKAMGNGVNWPIRYVADGLGVLANGNVGVACHGRNGPALLASRGGPDGPEVVPPDSQDVAIYGMSTAGAAVRGTGPVGVNGDGMEFGTGVIATGLTGVSCDAGAIGVDTRAPLACRAVGAIGLAADGSAGPAVFASRSAASTLPSSASELPDDATDVAVYGVNASGTGIRGSGQVGVSGVGPGFGIGVSGTGLTGVSGTGTVGVFGTGIYAVDGSGYEVGVRGHSDGRIGVYGSVGRTGRKPPRGAVAGYFDGPVVVRGPLTVTGSKSAAVPHPDGSHRLLYALESPEAWFEDFGEARLIKGKTTVKLNRDFAALVKTSGYHVFLTPYGDSNGLFVARRTATSFIVAEQNGGRHSLGFSYRIVARRGDMTSKRLERVTIPEAPALPESLI